MKEIRESLKLFAAYAYWGDTVITNKLIWIKNQSQLTEYFML